MINHLSNLNEIKLVYYYFKWKSYSVFILFMVYHFLTDIIVKINIQNPQLIWFHSTSTVKIKYSTSSLRSFLNQNKYRFQSGGEKICKNIYYNKRAAVVRWFRSLSFKLKTKVRIPARHLSDFFTFISSRRLVLLVLHVKRVNQGV